MGEKRRACTRREHTLVNNEKHKDWENKNEETYIGYVINLKKFHGTRHEENSGRKATKFIQTHSNKKPTVTKKIHAVSKLTLIPNASC
jgi:hypothetical protein